MTFKDCIVLRNSLSEKDKISPFGDKYKIVIAPKEKQYFDMYLTEIREALYFFDYTDEELDEIGIKHSKNNDYTLIGITLFGFDPIINEFGGND